MREKETETDRQIRNVNYYRHAYARAMQKWSVQTPSRIFCLPIILHNLYTSLHRITGVVVNQELWEHYCHIERGNASL